MNEVSKFERAVNELRDAVPPPSPKKKRRPDDVNHSVMRKEIQSGDEGLMMELEGNSFVNLYHDQHRTDVVFGGRRDGCLSRRSSIRLVWPLVATAELVEPVTNKGKGWSSIKKGQLKSAITFLLP
ncbi:hypothetical protein EVAR_64275_1 [Eumeta japonica]|uniref:Uncharacterized protein n=1 Tax=Eumeta variegata TaxID=151549 RepID=A0A4C2A6V5_EUMVA|nr:hypothetical protein EVAR_64275_1 [Eumeta japonica]